MKYRIRQADDLSARMTDPEAEVYLEWSSVGGLDAAKARLVEKGAELVSFREFVKQKDGSRRNDKRTVQLSTEAEFWKLMALKKAGTTIRIPRRRFLGASPEVERLVRSIIEENLEDYLGEAIRIEIESQNK